jgi:hypothetical protein
MKPKNISNENEISDKWQPALNKPDRVETFEGRKYKVTTRETEWSTKARVARIDLGILLTFTAVIPLFFNNDWKSLFSKNRVKEFWVPLNKSMPSPIPQIPQPQPMPAIPKPQAFKAQLVQNNKQPLNVNPSKPAQKPPVAKRQIEPKYGEYEKLVLVKNGTPLNRNQAQSVMKIYTDAIEYEFTAQMKLQTKLSLMKIHKNSLATNEKLKAMGLLNNIEIDLSKEQALIKEIQQFKKELEEAHNSRINFEKSFTFNLDYSNGSKAILAGIEDRYQWMNQLENELQLF